MRCMAYDCRDRWRAPDVAFCEVHWTMLPSTMQGFVLLCTQSANSKVDRLFTYGVIAKAQRTIDLVERRFPNTKWEGIVKAFEAEKRRRHRASVRRSPASPASRTPPSQSP